jgi:hypothetical protein
LSTKEQGLLVPYDREVEGAEIEHCVREIASDLRDRYLGVFGDYTLFSILPF